jgi:hypothetical protein
MLNPKAFGFRRGDPDFPRAMDPEDPSSNPIKSSWEKIKYH